MSEILKSQYVSRGRHCLWESLKILKFEYQVDKNSSMNGGGKLSEELMAIGSC